MISQKKKMKFIQISMIVLLIWCLCYSAQLGDRFVITTNEGSKNSNSLDVETNHLVITISQEEFEHKISDKENFWIYIGRPNCPDCQQFYPIMIEYLEKINKDIYYFNVKVKTSEKQAMMEFLSNYEVQEIPTIIHFGSGECLMSYNMQIDSDILRFETDFEE